MSRFLKNSLLFLCLLVSAPAAWAQSVTRVCGVELSDLDVFGWEAFRGLRGKEAFDEVSWSKLYVALESELETAAPEWPTGFANTARLRLVAAKEGLLLPGDWDVVPKLGDDLENLEDLTEAFGGSYSVRLPAEASQSPCAGGPEMENARAEFALFVELMKRSKTELLQGPMGAFAQEFEALEVEYDRYLFEGYPMFPWEAAVNSWFLTDDSIANGPPGWALSVFHPSAGVLAHVDSDTDGDLDATLLVEPIGFVKYSDDYTSWYGASIIASFPADREPGIGVALNYNQFRLGVTWHDDSDGPYDGAAVFLSIDLMNFIGEKKNEYKGYKQRLEQQFMKAKGLVNPQ